MRITRFSWPAVRMFRVGGRSGRVRETRRTPSTLEANSRGFHMVNEQTQQTFDCIYNDSSLGGTEPTTKWVGQRNSRFNYLPRMGPHRVVGLIRGYLFLDYPARPMRRQSAGWRLKPKGPSHYARSPTETTAIKLYDTPCYRRLKPATNSAMAGIYIQDTANCHPLFRQGANITSLASSQIRLKTDRRISSLHSSSSLCLTDVQSPVEAIHVFQAAILC